MAARELARISHQVSTAAAHLRGLARDLFLRALGVASATPALPSVEIARKTAEMRGLATCPGEKCELEIPIQRLPEAVDLPLPQAATAGAAGVDLAAALAEDLVLAPGARALIPTGFAIALPEGYEAQVRPRSGLALKHGIFLPNAPGTIDSDYRGEIRVIMQNAGSEAFRIRRGDRIAQLVVAPVVRPTWREVPELVHTPRAAGGFGHTGVSMEAGQQNFRAARSARATGEESAERNSDADHAEQNLREVPA